MKRSLITQINIVRQEIDMREKVYPRMVSKGQMRQSEADHKIADMEAVLATLVFMSTHEDLIRGAVEAAKADIPDGRDRRCSEAERLPDGELPQAKGSRI